LECAAIPGVLVVSGGMDDAVNRQGKRQLNRIVSTLTKLVQRAQSVETDIMNPIVVIAIGIRNLLCLVARFMLRMTSEQSGDDSQGQPVNGQTSGCHTKGQSHEYRELRSNHDLPPPGTVRFRLWRLVVGR
jgi:hypothetical protein